MKTPPMVLLVAVLALVTCTMHFTPPIVASPKPAMTPKEFAERIALVIEAVNRDYFIEIERGDLLRWAIHGLYERLGRRNYIPPKIAEQLDQSRNFSRQELRAVVLDVADYLEGDLDRYADIALERMFRHLDGRTEISDYFRISCSCLDMRKEIGVRWGRDPDTGMVRVKYPVRGSPAYHAGLRSGDLITTITQFANQGGQPLDQPKVSATEGLKLCEVTDRLLVSDRGHISVTVRRAGTPTPLEFKVACASHSPETIFGVRRQANDQWDYWLDPERKIGYLRFASFARATSTEFVRAVTDMHQQELKGLILDLRGLPGGQMTASVAVAEKMVGNVPICTIRRRDGEPAHYTGENTQPLLGFPLVCLVNRDTARSGEVLAAALQDHQRAVIVGERTAGEPVFSNVISLDHTICLRITTAVFYRPNGKKLGRISPPGRPDNEWGVTPDSGHEINLSDGEHAVLRDRFESQYTIAPAGGVGPDPVATWYDRHLRHALEYLRERID